MITTTTQANRTQTPQPAQTPQQPATTTVRTTDAQVRDASGGSVRGYGLDLDRDGRYDGQKDGVLAFDFDKNGDLSGDEVRDSRDALQAFGGNQDLDNSGSVDDREKQTAERLSALVARFDGDRDGRLSGTELTNARAAVITKDGASGIDDLRSGDRKAALRSLDPKSGTAVLDLLDETAATDDKPAEAGQAEQPAAGGPSKPKGPEVVNPEAPAGFLWKPESDSDGNLVILLPPNMAGKVDGVKVLSPEGQTLDEGRFSGVGNGDRPHFRFSKPGSAFPSGCQVEITMKDGSKQTITIQQPGVRNVGR